MAYIAITAFGTRGDVQPVIALGKALKGRGHRVRIVAGANFKAWIESHGLEAAPVQTDIQAFMQSPEGLDWIDKGTDALAQSRVMKRLLADRGYGMALDAWNGSQGAEVLISSFTSDVFGNSIAEKLGVRHLSLSLQPALVATRDGRSVINSPRPEQNSVINYAIGRLLIEPLLWSWYGTHANRLRAEVLHLPPQTGKGYRRAMRDVPTLLGYSAHVAPKPADWPENLHITGFWFLEEADPWEPSDRLQAFLHAGPPPVAIGFGSMTGRDPEALTRLVMEAVQVSGQRAVLLSGWAGLGDADLPASICRIDAAPHPWLFPRVAAAVHHGGAGTTAAGLAAGLPMVIVPHLGDQPFWGVRVAALGVGPRAIPRPSLTSANLGAAIRVAATDPAMRQRAQTLGALIRAEDGIARAVEPIELNVAR